MKSLLSLFLIVLTLSSSSFAQRFNSTKIDSFLNVLAAHNLAMGSICIAENGVIKYQKAIGFSRFNGTQSIAAATGTKYRIGSATKMFTAVVIFQLIQEGKLKPTQKLAYFFPGLPNADKITIRDMLYHRSGLHDYTHDTDFPNWPDTLKTHADMLRIISQKGSDFLPGTTADYSNSNYLLLGYIIEKVCKTSYSEAVKQRITKPLKLCNTQCGSAGINSNDSYSYRYVENDWQEIKQKNPDIHGGAGAIISTPADMVKFINAVFTNRLVSKASLAAMETLKDDYGQGMFADKYGEPASFGHNGRIEEFYAALWYFPKQKLAFAYCTNGICYPRTDLVEGILKICFEQAFELPFSDTAYLKKEPLSKYTGVYASDQIRLNCTTAGDILFAETKGRPFPLQKIAKDYFMNKEAGYFFEFNEAAGELLVKESDNVYHLKRTSSNEK